MVTGAGPRPAVGEQRLKELGILVPSPPEPFGTYVEAVRTSNLLFLTGMFSTEGPKPKFVVLLGSEFDVEAARKAAQLATLNVLSVAWADAASELLAEVGKDKTLAEFSARLHVEPELIFQVAG
jgi:enamine deaminase RidA (YjgF/YER057c/UK114 family)